MDRLIDYVIMWLDYVNLYGSQIWKQAYSIQ